MIIKILKQIWRVPKFFINDIITDIKCVKTSSKRLVKGEKILDPEKLKEFKLAFKEITLKNMFKESWMWIVAILFAMCMGYFLGLQHATIECNNYLYEQFGTKGVEIITNASNEAYNYTYNFTFLE